MRTVKKKAFQTTKYELQNAHLTKIYGYGKTRTGTSTTRARLKTRFTQIMLWVNFK